jgi:hypothetical protein
MITGKPKAVISKNPWFPKKIICSFHALYLLVDVIHNTDLLRLTCQDNSEAIIQSTLTLTTSPGVTKPFWPISCAAKIFSLKVIPLRPSGREASGFGSDLLLSTELRDSSHADTKKMISASCWVSKCMSREYPSPPKSGDRMVREETFDNASASLSRLFVNKVAVTDFSCPSRDSPSN